MRDPFAPFTVPVRVLIRPCRREDLPSLEWWGLFAGHRDLIRHVFERHEREEATVMLVAEVSGMASGQAWIDLSRRQVDGTGVIWALRVFPCLQGHGIGTSLTRAAEAVLRARGCTVAEVAVDKSDEGPRRLYERLGYAAAEIPPGSLAALAPPGSPPPVEGSQWILRKRLEGIASPTAAEGRKP